MGWNPMMELGFSIMSWLTRPEKGLILVVQMQEGQVLALCRASVHQGSWRMYWVRCTALLPLRGMATTVMLPEGSLHYTLASG